MARSAVDVEEDILSAIFKDAFPADSTRDGGEFAQYLAELSSYGVERLNREPDRLAEERAQILDQTQSLAFHNYKTFIQTAECCKEIFQDFQIIEKHVDLMLTKLPELNQRCNEFMKQANNINSSRKMNNLTLQKHAQLLEVFEMPQLMDTCVRNGYYEEALELAAHVKRLEKKHANIPVIANIVTEVKGSTQLMLNQLIHQLRTNAQLPVCLRVIGYLRRMDVFTETELRIKFLQARDTWFQSVLRAIPSDDPYYHINKTIEASRVHMFDIITQYRAIFSDEDTSTISSNITAFHLTGGGRDERTNDGALFNGWVVQKISQFLHTLELDLSRGVRGRLDSLLGQCMYFGLSFSRVGADFRGLLAPIFQRAALADFMTSINDADLRLEEMLQSYTLLGTPALTPSSIYGLAIQTSGGLQPPNVLLEFHPLAIYCNNILNAFNDLRLCAPISLAYDVSARLDQSLRCAVQAILAYHRVDEQTFTAAEQEKFAQLCRSFTHELAPFLNRCLQSLFPPAQLSLVLGVPPTELNSMDLVGTIDVDAIISLLLPLIPTPPPDLVAPPPDVIATPPDVLAPPSDVQATPLNVQADPPAVQATPLDVPATPNDIQTTSPDVIATPADILSP